MADSASDYYFQSDKLGLRRSSLFNIPGFFVGFSSKRSSDIDSAWSSTSALHFSFFSSLSNPLTCRPPKFPSQSAHQKKWDCSNVGLGIVNSLTEQVESTGEVDNSTKKKHIVFGPQVNANNPVRSSSLPRNYIISLVSSTGSPSLQFSKADEEVLSENRIETMTGNVSAEFPQVAKQQEGSPQYPSDELLSFCHSCKKKLENGQDIHLYRGDKAFCSFACQSETMLTKEEIENTYDDFSKGSKDSSCDECLFLIS